MDDTTTASTTTGTTTGTTTVRIGAWPTFGYRDADAALGYLVSVIGFRESAVYRGENGAIAHAELLWPEGGGIMFGGVKDEPWSEGAGGPGTGATYLVTEDVSAVAARVEAAGWHILRPVQSTDYGSTEFGFADPEGNAWSVGTYGGAHTA